MSHRLGSGIGISKQNVRLTSHLRGLHGCDVENGAIGGEKHVEVSLQVVFLKLFGKILQVEGLAGGNRCRGICGGHGRRHVVSGCDWRRELWYCEVLMWLMNLEK